MRNSSHTVRRFFNHEGGMAVIEFFMVMPFLFLLVFASTEIARAIIIKQKLEQAVYSIASAVSTYQPATQAGGAGQITWDDLKTNVMPIYDRIMDPYTRAQGYQDSSGMIITYVDVPANTTYSQHIIWQVAGGETEDSFYSIVNGSQYTPDQIAGYAGCAENAPNDDAKKACWTELQKPSTIAYPEPYATQLGSYTSTVEQGYVVAEAYIWYKPIFNDLMNNVNKAAGTSIATFNFSLPDTLMTKRTFMMSRNGVLSCLPSILPCS